jgi:hypothetical protein
MLPLRTKVQQGHALVPFTILAAIEESDVIAVSHFRACLGVSSCARQSPYIGQKKVTSDSLKLAIPMLWLVLLCSL